MEDSAATKAWDVDRAKLSNGKVGMAAEKRHIELFLAHAATQGVGYCNKVAK